MVTCDKLESELPGMSRQPSPVVAPASKQARLSEARKRLLEDVIDFLRKMKNGGESELGHNPRSEDLIPYFQRYAFSLIEVRSKEEILNAASISEARALIRDAVDVAVMAVCKRARKVDGTRKPAGVWFPTIKHACTAVNLGSWTTQYGTYDQTAFARPSHMQLRSLLLVQVRDLETQFWNRIAVEGGSAPIADRTTHLTDPIGPSDVSSKTEPVAPSDVKGHFPERAKWLKARLYERGWSPHVLFSHRGPDRGTTRRILKGLPVRPMTLDKVAEGLSWSKKYPNVSPKDIPEG